MARICDFRGDAVERYEVEIVTVVEGVVLGRRLGI